MLSHAIFSNRMPRLSLLFARETKLMFKRFLPTSILLLLCYALAAPQTSQPVGIRPQPPEGKGVVVVKAARLIDGTGAAPINNAIVIVTDNKITALGDSKSVRVPADAKVIDLGDVTLLPGFIDAHSHLIGACWAILK